MLPISVCILAWNGGDVLETTLNTYQKNGLIDMVNDVTILFQQVNQRDVEIASHFNLDCICLYDNIGIGKGFRKLAQNAETNTILLLEHDWNLVENKDTTFNRLSEGLKLLNTNDVVRYRHRKQFGEPLFSKEYMGKELTEYDKMANEYGTHLLESLYWSDPSIEFSDKIQKEGDWFITTSRWANFSNNPSMYRKDFYLDCIDGYEGSGIELEYNISHWWCKQNFKVVQGNGLFKHNDFKRYGFMKSKNDLI